MHADGDPAGAGVDVIARERTLPPLVERARRGERERMRWNDLAGAQTFANAHRVRIGHRASRTWSLWRAMVRHSRASRRPWRACGPQAPRAARTGDAVSRYC